MDSRRQTTHARHEPALVVDGYLRVATDRAHSASETSVARWRITRWTKLRGWTVGRILEEREPTPTADPRPRLRCALARVEARESDGIVIVKLDQLGPTLDQVLAAIERIQAAGGTFASVSDGIDLSTPTGRLMLRLLISMEEW